MSVSSDPALSPGSSSHRSQPSGCSHQFQAMGDSPTRTPRYQLVEAQMANRLSSFPKANLSSTQLSPCIATRVFMERTQKNTR